MPVSHAIIQGKFFLCFPHSLPTYVSEALQPEVLAHTVATGGFSLQEGYTWQGISGVQTFGFSDHGAEQPDPMGDGKVAKAEPIVFHFHLSIWACPPLVRPPQRYHMGETRAEIMSNFKGMLSTTTTTPHRPMLSQPPKWTSAQDVSLKRGAFLCLRKVNLRVTVITEALKYDGQPVNHQLRSWLNHYRTPVVTPVVRGPDFHERKRAALVARVLARKKRVDALMELRMRALTNSTRRWPRPRCHPQDKENQRRAEVILREEAARKVERDVEERMAADARMEVLMRLRAAGLKHPRKYY